MLTKKIEKVLEKNGIQKNGFYKRKSDAWCEIELKKYSPANEELLIDLCYDGTEKSFITAFSSYANDFDVDEHVKMWIDDMGNDGVPETVRELLNDSEWIKKFLLTVSNELQFLDKNKFRIVKLNAGMTMEFEVIETNAPDSVIMANMTYISACQESGEQIDNPYAIIESMGYCAELIGDQNTILEPSEQEIDAEFDYYDF